MVGHTEYYWFHVKFLLYGVMTINYISQCMYSNTLQTLFIKCCEMVMHYPDRTIDVARTTLFMNCGEMVIDILSW